MRGAGFFCLWHEAEAEGTQTEVCATGWLAACGGAKHVVVARIAMAQPARQRIWRAHRHECLCHRVKSVATVIFESALVDGKWDCGAHPFEVKRVRHPEGQRRKSCGGTEI